MSWWSSPSADTQDPAVRRFVEAARRAEIIALVNSARTEAEVAQATADEVCEALEAEVAFITVTRPDRGQRRTVGRTGVTAVQADEVAVHQSCRAALGSLRPVVHRGEDLLGLGVRHLVLSPWTADNGRQVVIGVGRLYDQPFAATEVALLEGVTPNVGHALERSWLSEERDRHAARQAALARAARVMSASLETRAVLDSLAEEVWRALEADVVVVQELDEHGAPRASAVAPPGAAPADPGLQQAVQALRSGAPAVRQPFDEPPPEGVDGTAVRSGLAAPVQHAGHTAGVITVGFHDGRWVDDEDVELLTAFAELAAMAWRNAVDHAAAKQAATTDALTGCLNHGAFQRRLEEEVARAARTGAHLAVALLDLDGFKAVNDLHGHLTGDAVLRGAGRALRESVRPYDHVARYGGDEFALLLPDTDEQSARRVLARAVEAVAAVSVPGGPVVTAGAGLAAWRPSDTPGDVLSRADAALLGAKRTRGGARPAGGRREIAPQRFIRAGQLGARLVRLLDEPAIAETAAAELVSAFGLRGAMLVRRAPGCDAEVVASAGCSAGLPDAAIRCLRDARPVVDASAAAVPVDGGEVPWALVADAGPTAGHDLLLLEQVAEHLGAALHAARACDVAAGKRWTTAALAAALEAKDGYTADHGRSIAQLAVAVGRKLGLCARELEDLRDGAVFHDIGKIAVPDAILNKADRLSDPEMAVVREHPVVGEQILAHVPYLAAARRIVRHHHERWDGGGYPDGLQGDAIPIADRIVLVVDAYHAMRSDRPYRQALTAHAAEAELLRGAGTQFDPRVVEALLAVLGADDRRD